MNLAICSANITQANRINSYLHMDNQTFASKKPEIRKADNIVRMLNTAYPRISKTNFECFKNVNKKILEKLIKKTAKVRAAITTRQIFAENKIEKIKAIPSAIRDYKAGNCQESAYLCCIAAKINGIQDFRIAYLCSNETGDLDHAVVMVKNKNKPYIMDAWLNFADYLPKAVERYQNELSKYFNLSNKQTEKIKIEPLDFMLTAEKLTDEFSSEQLAKIFPELILKN